MDQKAGTANPKHQAFLMDPAKAISCQSLTDSAQMDSLGGREGEVSTGGIMNK